MRYQVYIGIDEQNTIHFNVHESAKLVEDPERKELLFRAVITLFIRAYKNNTQMWNQSSERTEPDLKLVIDNEEKKEV